MKFKSKDWWDKGVEANQDGYGSAVYRFAERWADLMEAAMSEGETLAECADRASHEPTPKVSLASCITARFSLLVPLGYTARSCDSGIIGTWVSTIQRGLRKSTRKAAISTLLYSQ